MENDAILASRIKSDTMEFDHEAEACLLQKFYPRIRLKLEFKLHAEKDKIDDLTNEIATEFLLSLRNGNYDPEKASLGTYLNGIINFKVIAYIDRKNRARTVSIENTNENGIIERPKYLENMDNEKLIACLRHHLPKLRKNYREVFLLYYHDGLSVKQIAERLGRSSLTIANEKFQAVCSLRKKCVKK